MPAFVFDTLGKAAIYATCVESNKASARVLEKAGLKYAESCSEADEDAGIIENRLCYRLDAS